MINIQELRIGSLVRFKTGDEFKEFPVNFIDGSTGVCEYRVTANVHSECPAVICRGYVNFCSDLQPIPLTEGMLLKCGFEERQLFEDNPIFLFLNGFGLQIDYFEDAFYFDDTKIEYVHQLMNLYFALTGKELEVKL